MKKNLMILTFVFTLLVSGCASSETEPETTPSALDPTEAQAAPYRFSVGYSGTGYDASFTQWRDAVWEDTDGNVEIVLYGENILGEGKDMIKAVQRGTMSIMASSTSVCTAVVPETAILDIPSCFPEYSQPFQVYDGEFYDELNQYYNEQGLEILFLRTGEPWIISSSEPITSLEQLNGLRVRTSGSTYHNKLYDILGIERIEDVGLSGLTYILEENGVDALETTHVILKTQELLEAQPYALQGPFFVMSSSVVMNYKAFHSLPTDYQQIVKDRLSEILTNQQERINAEHTQGELQIRELKPEDQEKLKEMAKPLLDEILNAVDPALTQALVNENTKK